MYRWNRVIRAGSAEIRLEGESDSLRAFWAEMAFWDSLPQAGPGGEDDLQFSYRTPKGNEYFSILCPSAKEEFKFGVLKANPQQLFPKDWERAKHGQYAVDDDEPGSPPPDARTPQQMALDAQAPPAQKAPAPLKLADPPGTINSTRFWTEARAITTPDGQFRMFNDDLIRTEREKVRAAKGEDDFAQVLSNLREMAAEYRVAA